MAKMVRFQIFPSNQPIQFPNVIRWPNSFEQVHFIFWRPLLLTSHLCQPVKQMSDELKLGRLLPSLPPACTEVGSGRNRGQQKKINLLFAKSSLVCLSSRPGSNPVGLLPTTKRKVKSIIVCARLPIQLYRAYCATGSFERECLLLRSMVPKSQWNNNFCKLCLIMLK